MNYKEIISQYPNIEIGKAKNLIGEHGDFNVLYRTKKDNSSITYWVCQCKKCNNYEVKSATSLLKNPNCDCKNSLIGQKFGRWTVISLCPTRTKKRGKIWHCRCDCGNEKDVPAETLKRGESQSCGCLRKEIFQEKCCGQNKIDITGQRFGKLVALYPIYSNDGNRHTKWHCKCDCGNETDVDLGNLRQGFSKSCGCTHSIQEERIIKLLTQGGIPYEYQFRFDDYSEKEFDFYINNSYVVEFDGQQHFFYTNSGWDTEEHFQRTRTSDLAKNKYCFEHNIPLIRIPYNEKYELKDLQLETTRFLLTPDNEQNYYNRN